MKAEILLGQREEGSDGNKFLEPELLVSVVVDGRVVSNLKASLSARSSDGKSVKQLQTGREFDFVITKMARRTGRILRNMGVRDWFYTPAQRIRYSSSERVSCDSLSMDKFGLFSKATFTEFVHGF